MDAHLQKIGAVVIQTLVCMALYRSMTTGRLLNRFFSVYKVLLLVFVLMAGFYTLISDKAMGVGDFNKTQGNINITVHAAHNTTTQTPSAGDYAAALLLVLYSFHGWGNANYVCTFSYLIVFRGRRRNRDQWISPDSSIPNKYSFSDLDIG